MNPVRRQTLIGLALAVAIVGAWLAIHVWAIFFHRWSGVGWLAALPVVAAQSWLGAGMFIVAHDAIHGSLAPGRPALNRAIGQVAVGLYAGFSLGKLSKAHFAHHRSPGTAYDPDFHSERSATFASWFVTFFRHYFGWAEFGWVTGVILLYILVLRASPIAIGVFWGAPALFSAIQLFTFGTYLPHRAGAAPFVDRHRARTLDYPWLLSLLSCFHFGLHREHHGRPEVPWWRLPSVRLV